jgi:hypothetical protein
MTTMNHLPPELIWIILSEPHLTRRDIYNLTVASSSVYRAIPKCSLEMKKSMVLRDFPDDPHVRDIIASNADLYYHLKSCSPLRAFSATAPLVSAVHSLTYDVLPGIIGEPLIGYPIVHAWELSEMLAQVVESYSAYHAAQSTWEQSMPQMFRSPRWGPHGDLHYLLSPDQVIRRAICNPQVQKAAYDLWFHRVRDILYRLHADWVTSRSGEGVMVSFYAQRGPAGAHASNFIEARLTAEIHSALRVMEITLAQRVNESQPKGPAGLINQYLVCDDQNTVGLAVSLHKYSDDVVSDVFRMGIWFVHELVSSSRQELARGLQIGSSRAMALLERVIARGAGNRLADYAAKSGGDPRDRRRWRLCIPGWREIPPQPFYYYGWAPGPARQTGWEVWSNKDFWQYYPLPAEGAWNPGRTGPVADMRGIPALMIPPIHWMR